MDCRAAACGVQEAFLTTEITENTEKKKMTEEKI